MAWRFNDYPGNIAGSVFSKGGDAIVPPDKHIFVAITTLAATTFSNTTGLVAEEATRYANTEDAAGDAAAGHVPVVRPHGAAESDDALRELGVRGAQPRRRQPESHHVRRL